MFISEQGRYGLILVRRLLFPLSLLTCLFPILPLSSNWVDNEEMKQFEMINYKFGDPVCLFMYRMDQYFFGKKEQLVKTIVYIR